MLVGVILLQSILTTSQGIISLQDGQYNYSCSPQKIINQYLTEHYNGGKLLQDVTTGSEVTEAGMNFKNVIYQGSGQLWTQALHNPANSVDWIIVKPGSKDLVARYIDVNSPLFLSQFTLAARQTDGILLYHHLGRRPLPTRPLPPPLKFEHHPCG